MTIASSDRPGLSVGGGQPRVALDVRTAQSGHGGIRRALLQLVPRLAEAADLDLLVDPRWPLADGLFPAGVRRHEVTGPPLTSYTGWLQLGVPRWLRGYPGVFHCPHYWLPYQQPVPMVVTLHDLTFEHHPEWFSRSRLLSFRAQARHAARTARRILTDSEVVRTDIVERYGVAEERVLVAPMGVDAVFRPEAADAPELPARLGVVAPYLVALGGAPRRNVDMSVSAWRLLRRRHPDLALVVVGGTDVAEEPGLFHRSGLDDADFAVLLAGAIAFCYPTAYEGFGMPALEAIASGTPVVCAKVGALPEVLGPAAAWSDGLDAEAVAAALEDLLGDESRLAALRRAGLDRARAWPSWADSAAVHVRAYREAQD